MARIGKDALALTQDLVTQHIINTSVQGTFIEAVLLNNDDVDRTADLHFVPNGGSASDANKVIGLVAQNALKPGEMRRYQFIPFLDVGDFIQAKSGASGMSPPAGEVTLKLSILEEAV